VTVAVWLVAKPLAALRLGERHERRLREALPLVDFRFCQRREEFLEALPEADVAAVWIFRQEWLERAPRLRRIISPTAGAEWFPIQPPPGLKLEFSRFHGRIMAETVLGMMLGHARGLFASRALLAANPWPRAELEPWLHTLRGARLTVLGFGNIGERIARLAKACGPRITGLRRRPTSVSGYAPAAQPGGEAQQGGRRGAPEWFEPGDRLLPASELERVLPETDHLVLCLPASPGTDGILDARRLALLPAHAGIYNVGRGNAIDEEALAAWLASRPLAAAFLDVFREEPLAAHSPLRALPNCLILPHLSAIAPDFLDLFVEELLERLAAGQP
jgi:phosphoglycerate dehydrogenase-like enzyme